jgi:large subunit ribosomal protein L9
MKIILTKDVPNLGKIGEVVSVANGYAKNFLIPSSRAIAFTPSNKKIFEIRKADLEKANQENLKGAEKIKSQISGKDLIVIENASDDGRLYGSVNMSLLASKINEILGEKLISKSDIFLTKPIKEIGLYQVKINLHPDVLIEVRAIVTRSESEIGSILNGKKSDRNIDSAFVESSEEKKSKSKGRGNKKEVSNQ